MKPIILASILLLAVLFPTCKKPVDIIGCMDPKSSNYDPKATVACDSCCTLTPVDPIEKAILGSYTGTLTLITTLASGVSQTSVHPNTNLAIEKAPDVSKVQLTLDFVFRTKIANITNNGFEVPETVVAFTPQQSVKESGTATLNGSQLTVHFVQNYYTLGGFFTRTETRDGVMTKQ